MVNFSAKIVCHHLKIIVSLIKIAYNVYHAINYEYASKSIKELLKLRKNKHKLRGTNTKAIKDQHIELRPQSWRNIATKLWYSIPDKLRPSISLIPILF